MSAWPAGSSGWSGPRPGARSPSSAPPARASSWGPRPPRGPSRGGAEAFARLDLEARRARAWLALSVGDERAIGPVLERLDDPDPAVRTALFAFLSSPELGASELAARVEALGRLALEAPELETRAGALTALARLDRPAATAELVRLEPLLDGAARELCAGALAADPRAREHVVLSVRGAFADSPLESGVLATHLAAYGRRLAELPQGGAARADRLPFVLGARHPEPLVARRALRAVEAFEARCVGLGQAERARGFLRALLAEGGVAAAGGPERGTAQALARRLVRLGLLEVEDPGPALEDARALVRAADALDDGLDARLERAVGRLHEAAARLALAPADGWDPGQLEAPLAEAEGWLAGLAAERLERSPSARLAAVAREVELLRGTVELSRALARLTEGFAPDDPRVLVHARAAHEHALAAQLAAYEGIVSSRGRMPPLPGAHGIDELLAHPVSPLVLVLRNPRRTRVAGHAALDLELALTSAVACVAPFELPGVERVDSLERPLASPLADPARNQLLGLCQQAYYRATEVWIDREVERMFPDGDPQEANVRRFAERQVSDRRGRDARDGPRSRLRLRAQTGVGVTLAALLRADGRFEDSLALAERTVRDLASPEALEARPTPILSVFDERELVEVDARILVGDALMDLGRADRAELELLAVLGRIDKLEEIQAGGRSGASGDELLRLRSARVDTLVSLAVNANVKQLDPKKARGYFERAYAVGQSEFMQVLLACYRARDGDAEGAREALREVTVAPGNYYNLACTHALLGEPDEALDYLRRDLADKRASPGGLARQVEWAREDPDLAALRGDPRFEALLDEAEGWAAGAGR